MKNIMLGFLAAYTILVSCFTFGMYTGRVASIQQACVERVSPAPLDYVSQIERRK